MTKDIGQRNYRKLFYYFENKIPIHIKLNSGQWCNGNILDLNENKLTMVLKEFVRGELPILLEEIDNISEYKERGEYVDKV